ncbi:MAG TPA: hypothetical protein VFX97_00675 [Pyrinomonadaceae bacterium]|nr:hypothetical protein [Pyrinomonadaceae bacterium]
MAAVGHRGNPRRRRIPQRVGEPKAQIGEQPERIHDARIWVLPNPSGLNANYQLPDLAKLFRELSEAAADYN